MTALLASTDSSPEWSSDLVVQARRWAERGYQYQQLNEYAKAVACYTEAIQLLPRLDNVFSCRGTCLFQLADYTGAVADFSVELVNQSDNWQLYRKRALAYIKLEQYQVAIADFERIRRFAPVIWQESCRLAHASALYHLGMNESQAGILDSAIVSLTDSVQMAPEAAEGIRPRLMALHQRRAVRDRENEEKIQLQRQAEARYQSQLEAQRQRDIAARRQSEVEAYVHNNRALAYMEQGEYDRALAKFNEALRYDPTLIDAYVNRAQILSMKAQQLRDCPPPIPDRTYYVQMQRLLQMSLDSYHQALQLGLEFTEINSVRRATRRALLEVEREIEATAEQQEPYTKSNPLPDDDTDEVML